MSRHLRIFALFLMLFAALPLRGQWSVSADAAFGYGQMKALDEDDSPLRHGLGEGGFRIGHKSKRFQWNTAVRGSYENRDSDVNRVTLTGLSTDEAPTKLDAMFQKGENDRGAGSVRTEMKWAPSPARTYDAWLQYGFQVDDVDYGTFKIGGDIGEEDDMENSSLNLYIENSRTVEQRAIAGISTSQQIDGSRKVLLALLSFEDLNRDKENEWLKMDVSDAEMTGGVFRLTPRTDSRMVSGIIHFTDSIRTAKNVRLMIDPGLRVFSNHALDHNRGATLVDGEVWRDSTRLREDFNFLALRIEPYFAADMTWNKLRVHLDYAPQMYSRRLTDDTHKQKLKSRPVHPVGNGLISWTFSPNHKLTLLNRLEVRHPDYIQICWYERQGAFLNQIYRGKESLRSIRTMTFNLDYGYTYMRFNANTAVSYTRNYNEIDQTYNNEVIEGRQYQVFTWVNASHSHSTAISGRLGWRGRMLTANAGASYNGTRRTSSQTRESKLSKDWRAWADASLSLPHGWSMSVNANYRSDRATFFTVFKSYCTLNARIQKRFGKVNVFIQGRDLLDNTLEREYTSSDFNETWVESTRNNRRLLMLGMNYGL